MSAVSVTASAVSPVFVQRGAAMRQAGIAASASVRRSRSALSAARAVSSAEEIGAPTRAASEAQTLR